MTLFLLFTDNKLIMLWFMQRLNLFDYLQINFLVITTLSQYIVIKQGANRLPQQPRNSDSPLSLDEKEQIFEEIKAFLTESKYYLDPELTIKTLADKTNHKIRDISESINAIYENSFYYFINESRVCDAQMLLSAPGRKKIIDVAYSVGFNSKSSFNKMFKYFTKTTPSEFKRALVSN